MAKKKTGKEKTKKTHIAAALVPNTSFIAVPRTPPPQDADPEFINGPLVSGLLSSTMLGRLFQTQDLDDNDVVDTSLEDYANERNLTLEMDRDRLPTPSDFPDLEYDHAGSPDDYARVRYDDGMYASAEEMHSSRSAPIYAVPEKTKTKTRTKTKKSYDEGMEELMVAELAAPKAEAGVNLAAFDAMVSEPMVQSNRYGMAQSAPMPRTPRDQSPRKVDTPRTVEFRRQNDVLIKRQEDLERRLVEHEQNQMKLFETLEFMADNGGTATVTESAEKEKLIDQQATLMDHTLRDQDDLIKTLQDRIVNLEAEKEEHEEINTKLQDEIDAFKKYVHEREGGNAGQAHDSIHSKRQLQDLKDENETLKKAIWRSNQELSRYQAKYRDADVKNKNIAGLPSKGPVPSWLINTKYLAPLFLSYDDQLREKEEIVMQYEQEMETFAHRIEEIAKENERLHIRLEQTDVNGPISITEWSELQEQAKLVLEENQLLLQQLNIQNEKTKQMNTAHLQETSKLSRRLVTIESENRDLQNSLHDAKGTCANLTSQLQNKVMETELKVALPEHQSAIAEIRKRMEEVNLSYEKETSTMSIKVEKIQIENRDLTTKLSELQSDKDRIDMEYGNLKRSHKKVQKKNFVMQKVLEEWHEQESSAQHYLSSVVKAAEQTAVERDTYAKLIRDQEHERKRSLKEMVEGTVVIERMDEKLKSYKQNATRRLANVIEKLKDQEQSFERKKLEYELEIRQLKAMISDKEGLVDIVRHEKKLVEDELENMWKKTGKDNLRMRESVERTFHKLRQQKRLEASSNQDDEIKELLGYPTLEGEYSEEY